MFITDEILNKVKNYGALNMEPDQVVVLLRVPAEHKAEFLLMLATPGNPLYENFTHGKVIGDFNKEAKLEELSEKGDVDAITTQRLYRTRKKIDTLKKDLFGI